VINVHHIYAFMQSHNILIDLREISGTFHCFLYRQIFI